jgi:transcriptional regulator GlxA family with amidase domain
MSAPMPPHPILLVGYDNAQILDVACPSGALEMANRLGATPPYVIELATLDGGAVHTSSGIPLGAARGLATRGRPDKASPEPQRLALKLLMDSQA